MANSLTHSDVEEIAYLARLTLSPAEIESMRRDLAAILDYMDVLREVDTDGIEPMTHAVPTGLPLRPDEPEPSLPVAVALAGAAAHEEEHFQVPNVLLSSEGE